MKESKNTFKEETYERIETWSLKGVTMKNEGNKRREGRKDKGKEGGRKER